MLDNMWPAAVRRTTRDEMLVPTYVPGFEFSMLHTAGQGRMQLVRLLTCRLEHIVSPSQQWTAVRLRGLLGQVLEKHGRDPLINFAGEPTLKVERDQGWDGRAEKPKAGSESVRLRQ